MKIILKQDIRGKGKKGQMIEAAEGYARNYLIPRGLAVEATADAVNTMNLQAKAKAKADAEAKAEALAIAEKLKHGPNMRPTGPPGAFYVLPYTLLIIHSPRPKNGTPRVFYHAASHLSAIFPLF